MTILHEQVIMTCRDGAWRFRVRQERPLVRRIDGRWRWRLSHYALQCEPPAWPGHWETVTRTVALPSI